MVPTTWAMDFLATPEANMSISSSQGDSMPKPMIVEVKRPSATYKGSRFDLEKDLNVAGSPSRSQTPWLRDIS